ncbi:MAG: DUF4423 domain-containing protein [Bdellovibrionaceae bacterium]|nr:DUF4423 domain-containing protein [Bdellovibrionales bacterium]MCB9085926.1 DUF4423 domain-containing protein [Pseudobdellovibrionaceae bacterium]
MEKPYFAYKDYREALKARQQFLKRSLGKTYNLNALSAGIQVQGPYLSKVFRGDADLNEDQLYLALRFLNFQNLESEYLRTLHAYQRSHLKERKQELKLQLEKIRQKALRAEDQLRTPISEVDTKEPNALLQYFLDPFAQLTHMYFTIPRFQIQPDQVRQALAISEDKWNGLITFLLEARLIELKDKMIISKSEHLVLKKDSLIWEVYHELAKSNAQQRIRRLKPSEKNSLTYVFTCSNKSIEKIRLALVDFLKLSESIVIEDDGQENIHQLSVDLFPWS